MIFVIFPMCMFFIVFAVIITSVVRVSKKANQHKEQVTDIFKNLLNPTVDKVEEKKQEDYYCEYCGGIVKSGATECSNCGAKLTKK